MPCSHVPSFHSFVFERPAPKAACPPFWDAEVATEHHATCRAGLTIAVVTRAPRLSVTLATSACGTGGFTGREHEAAPNSAALARRGGVPYHPRKWRSSRVIHLSKSERSAGISAS